MYSGRKGSDSLEAMLRVAEVGFSDIVRCRIFFQAVFLPFLSRRFVILSLLVRCLYLALVMSHPISSRGATGTTKPGD